MEGKVRLKGFVLMSIGKNIPALEILHSNLSEFFDRFQKKYGSQMKCGLGCSQCCVGRLSVFPVEARMIITWFNGLEKEEKIALQKSWEHVNEQQTEKSREKCNFLLDNKCSIYPVRPVLCRAQGLPLKVSTGLKQSEIEADEYSLSLCELNFQDESQLPDVAEWLDLERVNTLLSIAEKFSKNEEISESLMSILNAESGRISLSGLQQHLLQKQC